MSRSFRDDACTVIGENFSAGEEKSNACEEIFFDGAPRWFDIAEIFSVVSQESLAHAPSWFGIEEIFFVTSASSSAAGENFFVDSALNSDAGEIFLVISLMNCVHGENFSDDAPFCFIVEEHVLVISPESLVIEPCRFGNAADDVTDRQSTRTGPPLLPSPRMRGEGNSAPALDTGADEG